MFLGSIAEGDFRAADLLPDDFRRAADLVRQYRDLPIGTTDATVIALTERLGLTEVATLDRRHFSVVRPRHVDALPASLTRIMRFALPWRTERLPAMSRRGRRFVAEA